MLVQKGFKILEVGNADQFLEGNIPKAEADTQHLLLRACQTGKPDYIDGAIQIGDKRYMPAK